MMRRWIHRQDARTPDEAALARLFDERAGESPSPGVRTAVLAEAGARLQTRRGAWGAGSGWPRRATAIAAVAAVVVGAVWLAAGRPATDTPGVARHVPHPFAPPTADAYVAEADAHLARARELLAGSTRPARAADEAGGPAHPFVRAAEESALTRRTRELHERLVALERGTDPLPAVFGTDGGLKG